MRLTTQTTSSSVSTEPPILPSKYWSWLIQASKPQLQVYTIPRSAVMSLLLPWHMQAKTWKLKPTQKASCQWRPTSTNTHGEDTEPKQRVSSSKCRVTPQCCLWFTCIPTQSFPCQIGVTELRQCYLQLRAAKPAPLVHHLHLLPRWPEHRTARTLCEILWADSHVCLQLHSICWRLTFVLAFTSDFGPRGSPCRKDLLHHLNLSLSGNWT